MSETVTYTGVLKKLDVSDGISLEDICKALAKEGGITSLEKECAKTWREYVEYELDEKYTIVNNILYELQRYDRSDCSDNIFKATRNDDGSISFVVQFYSGGCCFNEALETAIERMEKQS